jgi:hypothetical protein
VDGNPEVEFSLGVPMGRDRQPSEPKKIPTEILVAVIGLIGIGVTGYFGYLQIVVPQQLSLHATQTAEQRASNVADTQTARAESVTNTPTRTPTPSSEVTPVTPTIPPTRTPSGPGTGLRFCVNAFSIYVRSGPGTYYSVLGGLTSADCLYFDASNEDRTWLRVAQGQLDEYTASEGGWIYAELLGVAGPVNLPAITLTPTPTPTEEPTATPTPLG